MVFVCVYVKDNVPVLRSMAGASGSRARIISMARKKTADSMIEGRIKQMVRGILANKNDNIVARLVHQYIHDFDDP
jgi:hypothetical protein